MQKNLIKNWDDVTAFLTDRDREDPLVLRELFARVDFNTADWVNSLEIVFQGEIFASSITAGMANILLDLQKASDRIQQSFESNKPIAKAKHRMENELMFQFEHGCTKVVVKEFFKLLGKFKDMDAGARRCCIFALLLVTCGAVSALGVSKYFDLLQQKSQQQFELQKQESQQRFELQKQETDLKRQTEQHEFELRLRDSRVQTAVGTASLEYKNLVESIAKYSPAQLIEVSFNGRTYTKQELTTLSDQDDESAGTFEQVTESFKPIKADTVTPGCMKIMLLSEKRQAQAFFDLTWTSQQDLFDAGVDDEGVLEILKALKDQCSLELLVEMKLNHQGRMIGGKILALG